MKDVNKLNSVIALINALIKASKQDSNSCFTLSNELKLKNAIELTIAQQSNFSHLSESVKYIALWGNLLFKELSELGLGVKSDNSQETTPRAQYDCLNSLDSDLKSSYDTFKGKFKPLVHDFIKALPCVKHYKESELNTVINAFDTQFDTLAGVPNPKRYYYLTHYNDKLTDLLRNNYNFVFVNNKGVLDRAYWNGKVYATGDNEIGQLIKKIISVEPSDQIKQIKNEESGEVEIKKSTVKQNFTIKNFFNYIECEPLTERKVNSSYFIACQNVIIELNPKEPLSQPILHDFSPDIVLKYQCRVNYRTIESFAPETIEIVENYVDNVSGKDILPKDEYLQVRKCILEMAGAILFRGQKFKTFHFLFGAVNGGKSKFLTEGVFTFFDPSLIGNVPIKQLGQKFGADNIRNKVVNFSDEKGTSGDYKLREDEQNTLKDLVSDTPSETEVKNGKNAKFVPECTQIISQNSYLNLTDQATREKMHFVYFPNNMRKFKDESFPDFVNNQEHRDYLFYLCLQSLQSVLNNGLDGKPYFTKSEYLDSVQKAQEFEDCDFSADFDNWARNKKIEIKFPFNLGYAIDENDKDNKPVKDQYSINYYYQSFTNYLGGDNSSNSIRRKVPLLKEFKHIFLMYFKLHISNYESNKVRAKGNYFCPDTFHNKPIKTIADLKKEILREREKANQSFNKIDIHTNDQAKIILDENLDSGI